MYAPLLLLRFSLPGWLLTVCTAISLQISVFGQFTTITKAHGTIK